MLCVVVVAVVVRCHRRCCCCVGSCVHVFRLLMVFFFLKHSGFAEEMASDGWRQVGCDGQGDGYCWVGCCVDSTGSKITRE